MNMERERRENEDLYTSRPFKIYMLAWGVLFLVATCFEPTRSAVDSFTTQTTHVAGISR
jgi:cytochrome c oxidase subunit IV